MWRRQKGGAMQRAAGQGSIASNHFERAWQHQHRGEWQAAALEYRAALQLEPDSVAAHYNLGVVLEVIGDLDNAIAEYRHAIHLSPDLLCAHGNLGIALQSKGDLDGAI